MLDVRGLTAGYGKHRALEDVSLRVAPGEIVVILGANGAGKSTLLKALSGICEGQVSGSILMEGTELVGMPPARIVEAGVALVPEGRGIFGDMTVAENLVLGAYPNRARDEEEANLERVLKLFPKLRERRNQTARTMSGGEQQMVAIGRAMMSNPQILALDEPSLGLSPLLCKELFQNLKAVRDTGIGILLVEQNAKQSLAIADRGYLLENAHIIHEDSAENLASDRAVQKAYLGAGGSATGTLPHGQGAPAAAGGDAAAAAAAALESIPAPMATRARSTGTRSAESLTGLDIGQLVASASERQASAATSRRSAAPSASAPGTADSAGRLRETIAGIERAAAAARKPRAQVRRFDLHKGPAGPEPRPAPQPPAPVADTAAGAAAEAAAKPPVIEIYRAPRVEVWRRRPDTGEFDRK